MKASLLLVHAAELLTCSSIGADPLGRIRDGAVAVSGEHILALGESSAVLAEIDYSEAKIIDCSGKIVAPGFVDSHTHVVFGGSRVREYALKMTHSSDAIRAMAVPTGIAASVQMTRLESEAQLFQSARDRLMRMLRAGTTTVESKSGYGLATEHELKMLRVNRRLDQETPLDVISTFLGAHAFPPGVERDAYVREVIEDQIPAIVSADLAEFCDVYIDAGYFNLEQTRRILRAADRAGLKLKIHADQYAALGGSELAAELRVVSADHLNYTSPATMALLAEAGVVAVLMPTIDFAVRHPQPFDARAMLDAGMRLALATDICPGGWTESMQLVMQFACRQNGLTPEEALLAATVGGAAALDLDDRGSLAPGQLADIQIWDLPGFEDLIYRLGNNSVEMVIKRGRIVVAG